jgi:2-polyprenyl-3-methyl-5-hydroxy-6-metoxy-1,4-benzoquinol methylase
VSVSDSGNATPRDAIFDKLAASWSRVHYGTAGDMVPRIARFSDALAGLVPAPARVLDYGCGTGEIAAALAARGYQVEARDLSPAMIEQARALHGHSGVRFAVIETANAGTKRADELFDAVVCSSVLEYMRDIAAGLGLLSDKLRPGGYLLATVPNIEHPVRRREPMHRALMSNPILRSLLRLTPWGPTWELQWLSCNRMLVSEWIELFDAAQLRQVTQDGVNHPLTLLIGRRAS